jgi:hypothetical protein
MFHRLHKIKPCPRETIAWAAERIGISYEKLMIQLTAEEKAGLKAAYESWKRRENERKCAEL